jgi:teichuronic acid biosynthesis glycosyltransferase TuaC
MQAPSSPRIALVTPMLPVAHDQTRGRYIHETALALAKRSQLKVFFQQSHYPSIPFVRPRSYLYARLGPDYRLDGLDVEAFEYPALPVVSRSLNGMVSGRALIPRLRAFAPDLVLAYWVYPDGYAALYAARRLGLPCVVGALGSDIHVRDRINAWFTRRTIAGIDALLTVSEDMRRTAIAQFGAAPGKVHTVINGYNTSIFYPRPQQALRQKLGVPGDARLILYVGRFVVAKGMRELVMAFKRLAAQDPQLRLALVGDGVMREELLAMLNDTGMASRVMFPGGLAQEQVAEWIGAADLLCLPSWSEGYPNVVVEAVACGRPVVATDVGGTREIINAGNGILVKARDVDSLQAGLSQALSCAWDHTRIAAAIRRTWDDVGMETLAVCRSVIEARAVAHSANADARAG